MTAHIANRLNAASFAAVALTIMLVSGVAYFALAQTLTQVAALDSDDGYGIAHMAASRKVRCIMPPAQQKFCGVE